jgi:hypothetical protein
MVSAYFLDSSYSLAMAAARYLRVMVVAVAAFVAMFGPPRC